MRGTEIADSCTACSELAAAYESVITTLGATRLDMDVEDRSLDNTAGIDRRNRALRASSDGRRRMAARCRSSTPCRSSRPGWRRTGWRCCANAIRQRHRGRRGQHHDLRLLRRHHDRHGRRGDQRRRRACTGSCTRSTRAGRAASCGRWRATTIMPGIDDYPGRPRSPSWTTPRRLLRFARGHGHGTALDLGDPARQRRLPRHDSATNSCSGIVQPTGRSATGSSASPIQPEGVSLPSPSRRSRRGSRRGAGAGRCRRSGRCARVVGACAAR